jgi:sulfatase maturation enzyme AslB (radical SAM superfamily)
MKISKGIIEQNVVLENYDLSTLRAIKLIGGEPLMEQDKFINVLQRCDRKNLSIMLTTNGTLTPNEELYTLLRECKQVKINLSIDAYGPLNDYLRKGSKWDKTVENMHWFNEHFAKTMNIKNVALHSVASIYNLNHVDKLYNFVKETFPNMSIDYVLADGPNWMLARHLPTTAKETIKQQIEIWKQSFNLPLFKIAVDELNKTGDFNIFMKQDHALNELRNEHWKTLNPELYEMVKNYYE